MDVYIRGVLQRIEEVKASITSTFGRILKMDSTKKIVKKLAGKGSRTAEWATNVGNEHGQVLMSVILNAGEGHGLGPMVNGLVHRYSASDMPPPELLYVDRDCCGYSSIKRLLPDWQNIEVRMDIWHFMRRISTCCTTDSHPLYATFMKRLSHCIFPLDKEDLLALKNESGPRCIFS